MFFFKSIIMIWQRDWVCRGKSAT